MREAGDISWINGYIGIPYRRGGRNYDGVDCYGLVRLVYDVEHGIQLPDWLSGEVDVREPCRGKWTPTVTPVDGNFVVCPNPMGPHHMGLYYAGGVLHAEHRHGVIYQPIARFRQVHFSVEFGAWTP